MSKFISSLVDRLTSSGIKVTENCVYWRPILLCASKKDVSYDENVHNITYDKHNNKSENLDYSNIERCFVGRALNQYFIQKRIAETSIATVWRCFDIITNEFYCIKLYSITACKNERSVRFFRDDTEVITLLDKSIDEILYHSSLQSHNGVCKVKEVIVDLMGDHLYFIMSYYPWQLMYFDTETNSYCVPYVDKNSSKYLYNEETSKQILRELVKTVKYFHENGIIHKDIKPDNILLSNIYPQMFETFELSTKTYFNLDSCYDFTESIFSKDDLDVVPEDLSKFKRTEILTFKINEINGQFPNDFFYLGFPYNFSNDFDFFFTLWDDSEFIADFNYFNHNKDEFSIGKNSLLYAKQLSKKSHIESINVFDFFINKSSLLHYKVNCNFITTDKHNYNNQDNKYITNSYTYNNKNFVVISDFGVASLAEEELGNLVIFDSEGTISFTSPESLKYIEGSIPGPERDVFSLGVTLYCMIYGKLPYSGTNSIEMLINILETPLVFHPFRKISPDLKMLLNSMLDKQYEKRIKLDSILNHPWLNS